MFAALAVVVTVSMLVACLLQLSQSLTRQQVVSVDNKRAFYIAEAGLSEALYGLRLNKTGAVGTSEIPAKFGDGFFWVESVDQGSEKIKLDSVGMAGQGRFALSITVQRTSMGVGSLGIFAASGLSIDRGTYIDGYDSILGSYAAQKAAGKGGKGGKGLGGKGLGGKGLGGLGLGAPPPLEPQPLAKVGANVDVVMTGTASEPVVVDGDVTPGSAHSVLQSGVVSISGSTTPRDQAVDLPPIDVPGHLDPKGDLMVAAGTTLVLTAAQGQYGKIVVPPSAKLEILGPAEIAVSNLTVEQGGGLHFDASNGAIEVYVTNQLWIQAGATMSGVETPSTDTSLLVAAGDWSDRDGDSVLDPPADLRAQGRFFGTIYAPKSPLTLVSGFELFGGVVAESLTVEPSAQLHFDLALMEPSGEASGLPTLLSWKIVELPSAPIVKQKKNPKDVLEEQGVEPPTAYEAHDVKMFHVAFVGLDTKTYAWHGCDADFDPVGLKVASIICSYHDGEAVPLLWPPKAKAAKKVK